jgi:hypothetical protein
MEVATLLSDELSEACLVNIWHMGEALFLMERMRLKTSGER